MILEKLSVSGFRSFANRFEFKPDPRFTVIHAPNGTGKSTLLDALYYGLLERHSVSGGGAAQRFKCLGRDLTPTIEIDFAVDGVHYRLRKVFLSSKSASLQRLESGRYVAFKDNGSVDDFVRDLFFAEAPGKGPVEPSKHLGFAHVLWAPARASFSDLPANASDQIRAMLGGSALTVTDGERTVQQRATTEYYRFFKEEGGYTARAESANIPLLEKLASDARQAEIEARQQYIRLDRLNVAYMDREAEAERMSSVRTRIRTDIEAMKSAVTVYNGLKSSAERADRAEADARTAYNQVATRIHTLAAFRAERVVLGTTRAQCTKELEELSAAAAILHERFRAARKAVEDAGGAFFEVQSRANDVTAARSYVDSCESVEQLHELLAAYDTAAIKLAELTAAHSAIVAPTRTELDTLRDATAQREVLQATVAASALSLEVDVLNDIVIDVITGDKLGSMRLVAGATAKIAATEESVVIDVPGLGRIRAHGADGAAKARKKLVPLIALLEKARESYGTSDVAELAVRTERSDELKRSVVQTRMAMTELLGKRAIDDVRELLAGASARVASIDSEHPEWRTARPDASALRISFDKDLQKATDALTVAQIELNSVSQPKDEVDARIASVKANEAGLAARVESNDAQLKLLEADNIDDDTRAALESSLALTWAAAKALQTNISADLADFVEDPQVALKSLEESERDAGTTYERALGEAKTHRAQLDMQANLGSYGKLVAAEEHAARCEADLAAAKTQASAIACLSGAFNRIQAERVASVVQPVTRASTRYLTRIVGSPMGTIAIGEGLAPNGLVDVVSGLKLLIDGTLSSGEKEQIYLATRLALAEVIAKDRGRQLFVVDDALTATDPNRLRRFVGILEELTRDYLQVVVTTADPSRYLGIAGAKHLDLAAAILGDMAA